MSTELQIKLLTPSHIPNSSQIGLRYQGSAPDRLDFVDGQQLPFFYPPFVAQVYALLALLPYRGAYIVHTFLMLGCVAASVLLLRRPLARVARWPVGSLALTLSLYPLYRAVTGGQNTAITLLAFTAALRAQDEERPVLAGVAAGLLVFKPQFALPLIGLLALRDRRSALGSGVVAALYWVWGAVLLGPTWVATWFRAVESTLQEVADLFPWWKISFIGFLEQVFGDGSAVAYLAGGGLALAVIMGLVVSWLDQEIPVPLLVALACCGVLLIPNYVLWYEAGLLALPLLVLADRIGRAALPGILGIVVLAGSALIVPSFSSIPLLSAVLITGWWLLSEARAARAGAPALATLE